jgi:hypothetical protein
MPLDPEGSAAARATAAASVPDPDGVYALTPVLPPQPPEWVKWAILGFIVYALTRD